MRVHFTRDSVCAGDDVDAPHEAIISVDEPKGINDLLDQLRTKVQWPCIGGDGKATWCIQSKEPLAIAAQEWHFFSRLIIAQDKMSALEVVGDLIRIHAVYFAQRDPIVVHRELAGK